MFILSRPLSAKATRIESLQSSALEDGKIRTIHRVINPLFIIFSIVFSDNYILEVLSYSESGLLHSRHPRLLGRFRLF